MTFDANKYYNSLVPCHVNGITLCEVKVQPEGCPKYCPMLKHHTSNRSEEVKTNVQETSLEAYIEIVKNERGGVILC